MESDQGVAAKTYAKEETSGAERERYEELALAELGEQIVKDPTAVSDELFDRLRKFWKDNELVVIVGFAAQMIATNNFNSVFQIDIDQRLLPIKDEFKPATWRA